MKKGQLADVRKRSKESGFRSENGVLGSTEGRRQTNGKPGVRNRRAEEHTSIFKKPGEICLEHSNPQRNPETDTKRETDGKAEENRTNWSQDQATKKSSYKEHRVDAKAPYADEGRSKLRKAAGSCKRTQIRRSPNGETQPESCLAIMY